MGGDLTTKVLVVMAGLIACGACVGPLLYDPAVAEADEENLVSTERADLVNDGLGDRAIVDGDPYDGDAVVAPGAAVAPVIATDPDRAAVPFFVTLAVLLVTLCLTVWALLTPAAALGRPALIAGVCVLIGTVLAWVLYEAGVSRFPMDGRALAAWLCVGFTLIAAWLVENVLSTQAEDDAVPG